MLILVNYVQKKGTLKFLFKFIIIFVLEPTERKRTKIKVEESNENQESPIAPIKKRMSIESKLIVFVSLYNSELDIFVN